MPKKPESQELHKYIFEQIDKELRKVSDDSIMKAHVAEDLEKDIYPITPGINKLLRKFSLKERFHFEHKNKMTVHFTANYDENTLSVIIVK